MHYRIVLSLSGLLSFAGCAGGGALQVPIAGGQTAQVVVSHGATQHAESPGIRIEKAAFEIDYKTLSGKYVFGFVEKAGEVPRTVKVQDVTDDPPATWVEDDHPQLAGGRWQSASQPILLDDVTLHWLFEIDGSVRIYRFTIVNSDGSTVVLDEPTAYPIPFKEQVQKKLEEMAAAAAAKAPTK